MLSPQALYPVVVAWLQALGAPAQPAATVALAQLVVALVTAQSLRPTALMRALLSPVPVPARQRYKRLARCWARAWLTSGWLTPRLVRAALALVPPDPAGSPTAGLTHVALDSVRCGGWEVFTLGVVWHGRVLPVAWAVLRYPWPKGQVTPTVCSLVRQVAAVWPPTRPAHLVADRGFPSQRLFRTLRAAGWGWTIRLRAPMPVQVPGAELTVRSLLGRARPSGWTVWTGGYGHGARAIPATLVVGRGLTVLPRHQRTEGTQRHRAQRQAERQRTRSYRYTTVRQTDPWVALCTTHPTWRAAVTSYRTRWATEGTYRDAQGGWDGQHGWDLEPVVTQAATAAQVEHIAGLWALGTLLQTWLGAQTVHSTGAVAAIVRSWTTTGRLSLWARGQCALCEPLLADWLVPTLSAGAHRVATAPPLPSADHAAPSRRTPAAIPIKKAA